MCNQKPLTSFPGKLLSANSLQQFKFLDIVIYCKKSDLLILPSDLNHKLLHLNF